MEGVIAALRDEGRAGTLAVVVNELTPDTRAALTDDIVTLVIGTPLAAAGAAALVDADGSTPWRIAAPAIHRSQTLLPFEIYTSENV